MFFSPAGAPPRKSPATAVACFLGGAAGLVFILWLWGSLAARRHANQVRWANETASDHVWEAERHLANRDWDQAVHRLGQALAVPGATDRARAENLLSQARKGQAEALLENALEAVRRHDTDRARDDVQDYLTHPLASQVGKARLLREELDRATSDEAATALLRGLSPVALRSFEDDALTAAVDALRHEPLREVYRETLRRNLDRERQRRQEEEMRRIAQREAERAARDEAARRALEQRLLEEEKARRERAAKLARIRATPVYRELSEYLTLVRKQGRKFRGPADDDRELLAALVANPGGQKREDKARLLQTLGRRLAGATPAEGYARWKEEVEINVSSRRAVLKERFRAYPEFDATERDMFEKTVDRELDGLLAEVNRPAEDDVGLGLRALLGR